MLRLALRMWLSGMLVYVAVPKEFVKLFTVVKKVTADGRVILRLVWDLRRCNCRFRDPPWVPLGSPAALGTLELDEETLQGHHLTTFQGDVPDMFYVLRLPAELWPWFCL